MKFCTEYLIRDEQGTHLYGGTIDAPGWREALDMAVTCNFRILGVCVRIEDAGADGDIENMVIYDSDNLPECTPELLQHPGHAPLDRYAEAAKAEDARKQADALRAACDAAFAFIDSHVADPDITKEMTEKYAVYQQARKVLAAFDAARGGK